MCFLLNLENQMIYFLVPGSSINVGILSDQTFASLAGSVSDLTLKAVEEMGFKKMTEIQVTQKGNFN